MSRLHPCAALACSLLCPLLALACANGGPAADPSLFDTGAPPPPTDAGVADTGAEEDTGPPPAEDAGPVGDGGAECGNGVVEPGETCDGDCPEECVHPDDPCQRGTRTGSVAGCSVSCTFTPDSRDTDEDGRLDCIERAEGTDPDVYNGLTIQIGPEIGFFSTGSCDAVDSYSEVLSLFTDPQKERNVRAGWEYDTGDDDFTSGGYNADPPWEEGGWGRWQGRFTGRVELTATGRYCFSVDTGATGGNDLEGRRNGCGAVYVGTEQLAITGLDGNRSPHTGCANFTAGFQALDIVVRHRNSGLPRAKLVVRWCFGGGADCSPDQAITPAMVEAAL